MEGTAVKIYYLVIFWRKRAEPLKAIIIGSEIRIVQKVAIIKAK
jgi:hypothetical protein